MEIVNQTAFRFGFLAGRIPFPGHSLTLFVKGTFDLSPSLPATASKEQLYPTGDDYEPEDEERERGPRYPTDFVFLKERADLLLVGRCHAPGGTPTPRCNAVFQVGPTRHILQITGDRHWEVQDERWVPTRPTPFTEMPLRYDRAFGGEGFGPNPTGKGFVDVAAQDGQMVRPLPNIEELDALVTSPDDRPAPAGFGPLDPLWDSRRASLGGYGGDYLRRRWPWFAEDLDAGHFNAAPPRSQLQGYLRGDEELLFENLHPSQRTYQSALPGIRVRCFVNRTGPNGGLSFDEVDLRLDTLWVDMEAERLVLVWRGWTQVASPDHDEIEHVYIVGESLTDAPASADDHREEFASALAVRAPEGPPGEASEPSEAAGAASAEEASPELQHIMEEARPQFERLGIDPEALANGDPEVVVPELVEKLREELRTHGIDPDRPPKLTPEQKQLQTKILGDLEIPWDAAAGLPELEDLQVENPESMIDREVTKLRSELLARGLEIREPQDLTPEQKARLAGMGIDVDLVKEGLASLALAEGEGGQATEEDEPSPEWVRDRAERGESLAGADLRGLDLAGSILPGANLSGSLLGGAALAAADLEGADLRGANMAGADLRGAKLVGAHLDQADLTEANLTGADLTGATLDGVSGEGAVFEKVRMERCFAVGALFRGANFRRIQGAGACLDEADLTGADLERAKLIGASLRGIRLNGAKAVRAKMAQADVTGIRASRGADLSGASFFRATGSDSMWMGSNLAGADFRWARLAAADFTEANLSGARLHAADLPRARFRKADLSGATLTRVNLFEGILERADLTGADLRSSNLFAVEFLDATLSETKMERANLKRTKLVLEDWEP